VSPIEVGDTFVMKENIAIRVLLFAEEGSAKQKYLDALSQCGAQVFVTSSFFDLSAEICSRTYHGLFLDLPTKMKAIRENKAYVYRLVERFPVSHLKIDDGLGEIRCFHFNQKYGSTLLDFINNQCRTFTPQKIRRDDRVEIHLPVLVFKHQADKRPERSITNDLSVGGCFIFSSRRWKEGHDVWIRFKDIEDPLPIHAHIKTVVKWGKPRQIPGIGVQFKDLSPLQVAELARCIRPKYPHPSVNDFESM
jgi:hypothetical protein